MSVPTVSIMQLFGLYGVQSVRCDGLHVIHNNSLKALHHWWSQGNRPVIAETRSFITLGSTMMVVPFEQLGIEVCVRYKLNISVKTSDSTDEQVLKALPGMLSGPAVFHGFIFP